MKSRWPISRSSGSGPPIRLAPPVSRVRPESRVGRTIQRVSGTATFAKVAPRVVPKVDLLVHRVTGGRHIAGEEDYLLKVVAASPADYESFVLNKLMELPGVQRIKTTIVLSSPKTQTAVPIRAELKVAI